MAELERHSYDVIVIGAGGAGPSGRHRRPRGAEPRPRSSARASSARPIRSWRRAGIAAAMGNVYPEDNWKVHFRDTMRGGKLLNHWRMAELHAKEAPERVWELEQWGALFDRTPDGLISQRDFGGHRYARLAHVGDRTGLEMIRTLQQRTVALGIDVFMECTITNLMKDGDRIVRGVRLLARSPAEFVVFDAPAVVLATGGIGKSWKVTSNSWEYTGDGHALALRAGAGLVNMEFVQFHPTGMVWPPSVRGILVTESVRGDGGVLKNSEGERFMFNYIPEFFKAETADSIEEGGPLVRRQGQQPAAPRAASPRRGGPGHQQRDQGRAGFAPRRGLPRHRQPTNPRVHPEAAPFDVPPVQGAGRGRHHQGADGDRTDLPLRHGRGGGRPRQRRCPRSRACSRPARWREACTAPTAWAATHSATCSSSASGPASTPPTTPGRLGALRPKMTDRRSRRPPARPLAPFNYRGRREPLHGAPRAPGRHAGPGWDHPDRIGAGGVDPEGRRPEGPDRQADRRGTPPVQPGVAPLHRPAQHAAGLGSGGHGRPRAQGEPWRPHPRRLPDDRLRLLGQGQRHRGARRPTATPRCASSHCPNPRPSWPSYWRSSTR